MQHAGHSIEWSVLLAACSGTPAAKNDDHLRALLQGTIPWKPLFDLAEKHGAQPLLHQALMRFEDAIPPEQKLVLQQSYQTNLLKAMLVSRELIRIVDQFTLGGIDVMPYKGPALAEFLYGDVALRQSGDIDLLIRAQDFTRARDAVRELGYVPHVTFSGPEQRAYLKSGYEVAFDGAAGKNLLEIQWAIQPRFYAIDFDMGAIFHRAVTVSVAGRPMKTPSPEDLFLVLSAHAAKHVWARLVWLCDLARLIVRPNLNWDWIGSQAERLGMKRILRVTLTLASRLLAAPVPAAVQNSLPEDADAPQLASEIHKGMLSNAEPDVESMAYFRQMLRLRERPADRLRFVQRLMFTPGPSEWSAIYLPPALFPLYRVVRLSRLAARSIRS